MIEIPEILIPALTKPGELDYEKTLIFVNKLVLEVGRLNRQVREK